MIHEDVRRSQIEMEDPTGDMQRMQRPRNRGSIELGAVLGERPDAADEQIQVATRG